ncbi:hypothetical protein OIU78_020097 [Salix suchowensis]|nr:hypothetical protein OIU78_020097 [Salix suchowensis]
MPERDSVSWTTMINGYVRVGKLDEARDLLNEMPYRNIGAQTAMICGYIQCNKVDEARKLFDEISTCDVVCWNAMIAGYAHHGRINEALCLSKQMVNKDTVTWNTIISCYAQVGQMDRAVKIFEDMEEKDLVSWNSLIAGFMLNGQNLDALNFFALMGPEGEKPDQLSFACGLSSCATIAALQVGKQLHQVVVKSGGAVKEPGCSWVEVRNQVHGFLSDDSTQSRLDINVTLASLTSHIRNAFYISEVTA